jgi:hypothetical protein
MIMEVALRLAGISYPSFYEFDPQRGLSRHRPGAEGWWTSEGKAYIKINSDGLRDREHTLRKPPGTLRIAVLGDSAAEAFQVDADKAFWAVMQRQLGQCEALGGRGVEAINFGVAGYGTADELLTLREDVWKYDPDVVLLAFLVGNDVRNNSFALEGDPNRPYYVIRNGQLELRRAPGASSRPKFFTATRHWLVAHSRVAQLVNYVRGLIYVPQSERAPPAAAAFGVQRLEEKIYREPQDNALKDAWEVTEALIRSMNDDVKARGKTLFVATLSQGIQVDPDPLKREAFERRFGIADLFYPDRRITQLAQREGIASVMLAPAELQWAEENHACVHGFDNAVPCRGHWNEHGHEVAGEVLAREICSQVLSQPRSAFRGPPRPGQAPVALPVAAGASLTRRPFLSFNFWRYRGPGGMPVRESPRVASAAGCC